MPTARELLEQADAMMRRNRRRNKDKREGPPTLTDVLAGRSSALAPTLILPEAAQANAPPLVLPHPQAADPIALDTLSDLPVLTDVVDVWPSPLDVTPVRVAEAVSSQAGLDDALEADALSSSPDDVVPDASIITADGLESRESIEASPVDAKIAELESTSALEASGARAEALPDGGEGTSVTEGAVDPATRPPALEEEFILDIPPSAETAALAMNEPAADAYPSPALAPTVLPGTPDWDAMAEEIRMQVLQRLDLFTDTGMRDQLGARLQPIVNRASAELVETINGALGELVRGYVAEAIEREIDSWRKRGN